MLYRSETMTMAVGGDKRSLPLSFIPVRGPRLGRNIIKRLIIRSTLSITTNGSQTVTAAGLSAIVKNFRCWDAQGDLWRLTGPELRSKHIENHGQYAYPDPALVPISQTGTARIFYHVVDFAPFQHARRPNDTALPADVLYSSGGIEIETENQTALGSVPGVTVVSNTCVVYADCYEEFDLQAHSRREVRSYSSANLTDLYMNVNGALIRSCYAYKFLDHITGGTDLSSTTDVTIEALGLNSIPTDILQAEVMLEGVHTWASTVDPFSQSTYRIIPIIRPTRDLKLTSMVNHDGQILIRLNGNTVNNLPLIMDLITRQTPLSMTAESQQGGRVASIKTDGKSSKDPAQWGKLGQFMPKKLAKG